MSNARAEAQRAKRREIARDGGWAAVRQHIVLGHLAAATCRDPQQSLTGTDAWATINNFGHIVTNRERDGESAEWTWAFAHLMLHIGLDHLAESRLAEANAITPDGTIDPAYSAACCVAVQRFAEVMRIGREPYLRPDLPGTDELSLTQTWRERGIPPEFTALGAGGSRSCLVRVAPLPGNKPTEWAKLFARGLSDAATSAMREASGEPDRGEHARRKQPWDRAMSWFVSSYPLLGALATGFTIVADPEITRAWQISVAAVSREHGEIYLNPYAGLTDLQWRFVLAHEMLHAALRHDLRAAGRDTYLWNVACDYVINGWLVEMGVGEIPPGSLYDQQLAALSAESVYDTIGTDLRRARKLRTLGGHEAGDVLGDWLSEPDAAHRRGSRRAASAALPWQYGDRPGHVDLDDFYRRALTQGLEYHDRGPGERGYLALGLEQEIRALEHPPLPWDARLAQWFDEHVRVPEPLRSYGRAARRQAASPDIPRPGRVRPEEWIRQHTFGVVLDTSGSMPTPLLARALGAIAAYASARDVPAARVVFCDAVAYDAGYLSVTEIAGRVKVRGRGGTILQTGVDLLQRADDFPPDGPILIITDGYCDVLRVRREHAFLVPVGAKLPFTPRGPVFRVSAESSGV